MCLRHKMLTSVVCALGCKANLCYRSAARFTGDGVRDVKIRKAGLFRFISFSKFIVWLQ